MFPEESRYHANERVFIMHALALNGFNRSRCAKYIGLCVRTLRSKLKKYKAMGIEFPDGVSGSIKRLPEDRSLSLHSPIAKARAESNE